MPKKSEIVALDDLDLVSGDEVDWKFELEEAERELDAQLDEMERQELAAIQARPPVSAAHITECTKTIRLLEAWTADGTSMMEAFLIIALGPQVKAEMIDRAKALNIPMRDVLERAARFWLKSTESRAGVAS